MITLINDYHMQAQILERRSKKLALEIAAEADVDKLHSLERRKHTIDTERYEILRDIKDMLEHLNEEERERWQESVESA